MKRTFSLGNVLILQMDSPSAMMSDHVTQEDIDCVMIERMVCFLLLLLKHTPRPWTFSRTHVNDFFEMGNAGSQEDHDQPEWTLTVGTTQVALARILIERDPTPPLDVARYFLAQDKEENEEDDDEEIGYQSGSDCDWPLDEKDDALKHHN